MTAPTPHARPYKRLPALTFRGGAPNLLQADLGGMDLARAPRASADLKTRQLGP